MIRPATNQDVGAIARLERILFGADAWTEAQIVEELLGPGRQVLVIPTGPIQDSAGLTLESAGESGICGYVVTRLVDDVADLQRIGVHPDAQRHGLASALLAEAVKRPAARMLLEVAESNHPARALYATSGFVEIHRRSNYYRDGSDALVLERGQGG